MSGFVPGRAPGFLFGFAVAILLLFFVTAPTDFAQAQESELSDRFFELVEDGTGRELLTTGINLSPGDEIYVDAGYRYRIVKVRGLTAYCRIMNGLPKKLSFTKLGSDGQEKIGVYHTHGTEGFKDGSNYYGGITQAGRSALLGVGANPSTIVINAKPIREGTFALSRAQAKSLKRKGCNVLLDIHRDTAPAPVFLLPPRYERASSILLVVGKDNKEWTKNLGFALALKAAADPSYDGLVRGVLVTKGRFNQDLSPYSLSILVGDNLHETVWAERAVAAFTSLIPAVVFGIPSGPYGAAGTGYAVSAPNETAYWGDTVGNLKWSIIMFVTLIIVVGGYALMLQWGFSDWRPFLKKAKERWEPAFLGRLRKRR